MKKIVLIFAFLFTVVASFGQKKQPVINSLFFSTFQGFLDNADGKKINSKDGKILHQQFTEKSILISKKREDIVWKEEVFDIEWLINQDNTHILLVDDENKSLFRFEIGFLSDYSYYYYYEGKESKGELRKTKSRIRFYILRKDLSEFREFLYRYNIGYHY
jgi:hypothetical protein